MPWHPVPSRAATPNLFGECTLRYGLFDLQSADFFRFFMRDIIAAAGLGQYWNPVSGAIARRHFDVMFGCFVFGSVSFAFQLVLFGLYRLFFIIGGKKDAVCVAFLLVFLITADREIVPISFGASPFHQIGWVEPYWKNAFVRFRLLNNRYSITVSAKTIDPTAVSANPTKNHSKTNNSRRNEQSIPPIMKNERPNTQRNLLKRVRYRPEHKQLHQIPKWRLATCTGIQLPISL